MIFKFPSQHQIMQYTLKMLTNLDKLILFSYPNCIVIAYGAKIYCKSTIPLPQITHHVHFLKQAGQLCHFIILQ